MSDNIQSAIQAIGSGKMVIVTDDEQRENEGDLVMAAAKVNSDAVNFMATHGKGLICVPMDETYAMKFGLGPMVGRNTEAHGTNFTVSVDYKRELTTGIAMAERARTILALSDFNTEESDLLKPGHVFPIVARTGGVFERPGHTEAAVELAKLAGLPPVGVICEIIKENGEMARMLDLKVFGRKHGLVIISIKSLIEFLRG